jgi:carboxypeptidase C (cathepsin A)
MYQFLSFLLFGFLVAGGILHEDGIPSNQPQPQPQHPQSIRKRKDARLSVFEHAQTGSSLRFVQNSGVCETTPNVQQYSGYLSVGANMNMWFWFFEARNNSENAPTIAWFNGGPGCSSMIGLFQVFNVAES